LASHGADAQGALTPQAHVLHTLGAHAGRFQATSRQRAQTCCSRSIAGSTRGARARKTMTGALGEVQPLQCASGCAVQTSRALHGLSLAGANISS